MTLTCTDLAERNGTERFDLAGGGGPIVDLFDYVRRRRRRPGYVFAAVGYDRTAAPVDNIGATTTACAFLLAARRPGHPDGRRRRRRVQPVLDPLVGGQPVEPPGALLEKSTGRVARFRRVALRPKVRRQFPPADGFPFHDRIARSRTLASAIQSYFSCTVSDNITHVIVVGFFIFIAPTRTLRPVDSSRACRGVSPVCRNSCHTSLRACIHSGAPGK